MPFRGGKNAVAARKVGCHTAGWQCGCEGVRAGENEQGSNGMTTHAGRRVLVLALLLAGLIPAARADVRLAWDVSSDWKARTSHVI